MKKLPFKKAEFFASSLKKEEWPNHVKLNGSPIPEIALVGRSNVGKSSLLNHLLQTSKLAKVSSTPGKTQRINFFLIDEEAFLVDLPGYGYAQVSKSIKKEWSMHLEEYLNQRKTLKGVILLLDIRHLPTDEDHSFVAWALFKKIPLVFAFTKTDKVTKHECQLNIKNALKSLYDEETLSNFPIIPYSIKEPKCKNILIETINHLI